MGCGSSRMNEDDFYIEATRSVQTSPLMWDQPNEHHEPLHLMNEHERTKWDNSEIINSVGNAVHDSTSDHLEFEKHEHLAKEDIFIRSPTLLDLHDHNSDSPIRQVFLEEYAKNIVSQSKLSPKKKHLSDHDEGYKSDSNSRHPRIRHREIATDPEHRTHRKRRSRRRPKSVDVSVGANITSNEVNEKKTNMSRPKRRPGEKYANQTSSSNVSAVSTTTSNSSNNSAIRVAGGKHRKGQPPPPWRVHYVQSKPSWMNDYLIADNDL